MEIATVSAAGCNMETAERLQQHADHTVGCERHAGRLKTVYCWENEVYAKEPEMGAQARNASTLETETRKSQVQGLDPVPKKGMLSTGNKGLVFSVGLTVTLPHKLIQLTGDKPIIDGSARSAGDRLESKDEKENEGLRALAKGD